MDGVTSCSILPSQSVVLGFHCYMELASPHGFYAQALPVAASGQTCRLLCCPAIMFVSSYWCLAGNGWEWGNGIIINDDHGSFLHSRSEAPVGHCCQLNPLMTTDSFNFSEPQLHRLARRTFWTTSCMQKEKDIISCMLLVLIAHLWHSRWQPGCDSS